jgi:hypothetical protein
MQTIYMHVDIYMTPVPGGGCIRQSKLDDVRASTAKILRARKNTGGYYFMVKRPE